MKRIRSLLVLGLVSILLGFLGTSCTKKQQLDSTKLSAIKVDKAPEIDGKVDGIWGKAPELVVPLAGFSDKVSMKALCTDTDLFILAKWPDKTASFTRSNSWIYKDGKWENSKGQSEDRIALMWPIGDPRGVVGDMGDFSKNGCLSKCHTDDLHPVESGGNEGLEDECYLNSGRIDSWHMKAARFLGNRSVSGSNPVVDSESHQVTGGLITLQGWCDDKYVAQYSANNAPDGGRYGDEGKSADSNNSNNDKTAPKYIETSPKDFMDAMFLTEAEVSKEEAVEVEGLANEKLQEYWDNYDSLSAVVPEKVLRAPAGSRADIEQGASWADGHWTSEFKRALATGNDDDVQFDDLKNGYLFGIATMDNCGGDNHKVSQKQTLVFVK